MLVFVIIREVNLNTYTYDTKLLQRLMLNFE